ncbi:MAG TPA: transcription repressor NadR, partial [Thermoanaerobacterales bacterium]|nr:transcription repressor NadR [Thermoanaerobacterales bacterium]
HKMEHNQAALLSQLTDGVHLHTVEALNKDSITKAEMLLKKKGILLE